jgi:hypothetical protein
MKRLLLTGLLVLAAPAVAQEGPPPPETVIAQLDANGDKGIDAMEWPAEAPIPFPAEADTNKDGKIDLAELTALFEAFRNGTIPPPNQG